MCSFNVQQPNHMSPKAVGPSLYRGRSIKQLEVEGKWEVGGQWEVGVHSGPQITRTKHKYA